MKPVTAVVISAIFAVADSQAQETSTLLGQLTGKSYLTKIFSPPNDFIPYIVYSMEEQGIKGIGISMPNEMVLIHAFNVHLARPRLVIVYSEAAPIETIAQVGPIHLMKIDTTNIPMLKNLKYPKFYKGEMPKGLETSTLGAVFKCTASSKLQALLNVRKGQIVTTLDGKIYVNHTIGVTEQAYERIGDPLFVNNELAGILDEKCDSTGVAKYQEVGKFDDIIQRFTIPQNQGP